MKKLLTVLLVASALPAISQFTFIYPADTFQTDHVDKKFEFLYSIVSMQSTGSQTIRWRLNPDFAQVSNWKDNVCEGTDLCFPASTRTHDFDMAAGDTLDIYHYINAKIDTGVGHSTLCFFNPTDSAGTEVCLTMTARGLYSITGLRDVQMEQPTLMQNAPNPFHEQTIIGYSLRSAEGTLKVHDLSGKLVQEISLRSGSSSVALTTALESGIYFYSLWEEGKLVASKQMMVH